ncbi:hypothetical protein LC040_01270 [Bacillus tianshenii]|nr:hypothetical protein LC040_01270 [Bacillus tianshenii]
MNKKLIVGLSTAFLLMSSPALAEKPEAGKAQQKVDKVLIQQQEEEQKEMSQKMETMHQQHPDAHIKKHANKIISNVDKIEKDVYEITKGVMNYNEDNSYIDKDFEDFDKTQQYVEKKLNKQEKKLDSFNNKITALAQKTDGDNPRITELYERIDELQADVHYVYAKLDRMNFVRETPEEDMEYKAPAKELMSEVNGVERDVYYITQELDNFHDGQLEGQFETYAEAQEYFEGKLEQEQSELSNYDNEIAALAEDAGTYNPRVVELYERVDELDEDIAYILAKLDRVGYEHENMNDENTDEDGQDEGSQDEGDQTGEDGQDEGSQDGDDQTGEDGQDEGSQDEGDQTGEDGQDEGSQDEGDQTGEDGQDEGNQDEGDQTGEDGQDDAAGEDDQTDGDSVDEVVQNPTDIDPALLSAVKEKLQQFFEVETHLNAETNEIEITATSEFMPGQVYNFSLTQEQLESMAKRFGNN